jgi:hypothetical protein
MCLLVSTPGGAWSNRYRQIERKLAFADLEKLSREHIINFFPSCPSTSFFCLKNHNLLFNKF